jgi:hypothetical protein
VGHFFFGRLALEPLLGGGDRRLDALGLAALLARRPVQAAQAVEDRPPDFMLGVSTQLDVLARIEVVYGRNQSDDSR